MIDLLAKLLLKNSDQLTDPKVRSAYGTLCSVVAIVLNVILSGVKFILGTAAGSVSISADAINNLTDAGSSILILLGFKFAGAKPRPDRPFGHGRIEYVTGLIVAALVLMAGWEALQNGVTRIVHPEALEFSWVAVIVLALSIAVKFYMSLFHKQVGRKIGSKSLEMSGAECMADTVSTFLALVCLLIFKFTNLNLDAWAGVIVSLLILKAGVEGGWDTLKQLLGTTPDPELVQQVEDIAMSYPEIIGIHDLIIHDYGPGRLHISLHCEVDGAGDIYVLHDAMDRAMAELDEKLGCESVIHMDPVDTKDEAVVALRAETMAIAKSIDEAMNVHDFRVIPGTTHTNLVFDVLVPLGCSMSEADLKAAFNAALKKNHPDKPHYCVIKVDRPYV